MLELGDFVSKRLIYEQRITKTYEESEDENPVDKKLTSSVLGKIQKKNNKKRKDREE